MKVKVSKKLRGELSIDAIGFPLKAGQVIELDSEQEKSPNVLTSIMKGLLIDVNAVKENVVEEVEETVKEETTKKMTLTELNKANETDDLEEENKIHEAKKETEKIQKEIEDTAPQTDMRAFDMEKRTMLNKEESTKVAMDRVGGIEMDDFQVSQNIDFSDESEPDEINPLEDTKKQIVKKAAKKKTRKKSAKKTTKKAQDKLKAAAKKMSETGIKPVGKRREESTTDMLVLDSSGEDISFVDQEQEQKLIESRTKLTDNENDIF